jgi:hypothetical protein
MTAGCSREERPALAERRYKMAEKHFSRDEAEQLLARIEPILVDLLAKKRTADSLEGELSKAATRIMMAGGSSPAYGELAKKRSECTRTLAQITESIAEIQRTGCLVKDLDQGLVDFPCRIEGREAFLCWKLGEKRIGWWHGIEEGFAGRKPIDDSPPEESSGPDRVQ